MIPEPDIHTANVQIEHNAKRQENFAKKFNSCKQMSRKWTKVAMKESPDGSQDPSLTQIVALLG